MENLNFYWTKSNSMVENLYFTQKARYQKNNNTKQEKIQLKTA